jgi:NAD(P)-dependent dehydrogenase (short-subunit alcohol dehydrogenase family)
MGTLQGRAAIITGAGDGIGHGIARRFAREGADILVAELKAETGERVAAELTREFGVRAQFLRTDVTRKDQVEAMVQAAVDRFGRLDILVNNAWGGGTLKRLENKTDADMAHGMDMTMWAAFWAMKAAFPHMRAQKWGRIINLCSLNGVNAHMYSAEYNVGKEALRTLTRTAAREWAGHGICANVICPGAASASYRAFAKANPEAAATMAAQNPMGRIGDPESDIGGVALFLAGEDCRYLTGNTLFVDGGSHINGVAWAPQLAD